MDWPSNLKRKLQKNLRLYVRGNLTVRYLFALGLIATLSLFLQIVIQQNLAHQRDHFETLQEARKHIDSIPDLRTYLYALQSEIRPGRVLSAKADLLAKLNVFLKHGEELWIGNGKNNIIEKFGRPHSPFRGKLLQVFGQLKYQYNDLAELNPLKRRGALSQHLVLLSSSLKQYQEFSLEELERYDQSLARTLELFRRKELLIFLFTLLALLFEALFIFRPAIARLNHELSARSAFFGRLGHEIKNPLSSIIGMADLLSRSQINQVQRLHLQHLKKSAEGLVQFLGNMLEFSGIEQGKIKANKERVDLVELIDEVLAQISFDALKKELGLYVYLGPQVPQLVITDYLKLKHILVNLMGNAIKFTKEGHISLKVDFNHKRTPNELSLMVVDTGIGISKEQQQKIFDCFVQADSSIQRTHGGTGLGLSIVREYLDLLHGDIHLESEMGKGCRFTVTLPLSAARQSAPIENKILSYENVVSIGGHELNHWVQSQLIGHPRYHRHYFSLKAASFQSWSPQTLLLLEDLSLKDFKKLSSIPGPMPEMALVGAVPKTDLGPPMSDHVRIFYPLVPWSSLVTPKVEASKEAVPWENAPVLICDDALENCLVLESYLNQLGVKAKSVSSTLQLEEFLEKQSCSVLFLDVELPEMEGPQVIKHLHAKGLAKDCPIVAYTAHDPKLMPQKFIGYTTEMYLLKPVKLEAIQTLLERLNLSSKKVRPGHFEHRLRERLKIKRSSFFQKKLKEFGELEDKLTDIEALQFFGHKLKGAAGQFGEEHLALLGAQLEKYATQRDLARAKSVLAQIQRLLSRENVPKEGEFSHFQ